MRKSVTIALAVCLVIGLCLWRFNTVATSTVRVAQSFTIQNYVATEPLVLDFPGYRVRVDGWSEPNIEVEVDGKADIPVQLVVNANRIAMLAENFHPPLWEPAVRVKVPHQLRVTVQASELWARDCTVGELVVKRAHIRDCNLPDALRAKLPHYGSKWETITF